MNFDEHFVAKLNGQKKDSFNVGWNWPKRFEMLKKAGFDDWSKENCFLFEFRQLFKICTFVKLDGYTNKSRNGKDCNFM